jgi:SpoIID/LytB domain protein
MQTPGRHGNDGRRRAVLLVCALATAVLTTATVDGSSPAAAQDEPISEIITINGRGFGHGRGLSQWGAFGYATGRSGGPWNYRTILDHYFGNTEVGDIGNPKVAVTLLGRRSKVLVVERFAGVTVAGQPGTSVAVRVTPRPDGRYDLERSGGCGEPWLPAVVVDGPVRLQALGATGATDDALRLCREDGSSAGYRGELVAMNRSFDGADVGLAQTVNVLPLDDLLRSVVPRQVPPSWGTTDGGLGRNAVLAQVVAARGFVAPGDGRWHDLHSGLGATVTTCDTTLCQLYEGVDVEDPITDETVVDTSGEVRVREGALVRTEFTASSGGWTAGGAFPHVFDLGDFVSANPNRHWTAQVDRAAVESRYALGRLQAITVLERNGFGEDGGRVLRMRLVGTAASVEITGQQFRTAFLLRSDWFTVSGAPPRPPVEPRSIDDACPPDSVPDAGFHDVLATSVHRFPIDCVAWWGVTAGVTATTYEPARDVTRAQMASLVARLFEACGGKLPEDPPDAFADDDGIVHEQAINGLASLEIVQGTAPQRFDPSASVERAQAASLIARVLARVATLPVEAVDAFADDTGSVHEGAINALAAEGIVTGVSAGRFEPEQSIRRDQVASLVARAVDLAVDQLVVAPP